MEHVFEMPSNFHVLLEYMFSVHFDVLRKLELQNKWMKIKYDSRSLYWYLCCFHHCCLSSG